MRLGLRPLRCLTALILWAVWSGGVLAQGQPASPDTPVTPLATDTDPQSDRTDPVLPNSTIEAPADAPQMLVAPILTVDQDELFSASAWGRRTQDTLENRGQTISAENDRLAAQLSQEEAALTQRRGVLDPAEFRRQAEAFDARATRVRRERAQAVKDLNDWAEADRNAFYRAALPMMGEVMQDRRAIAVLDRRTVFVSLDAIDITADLIARLDEELGDGEGQVPFPADAAQDTAPTETAPAE